MTENSELLARILKDGPSQRTLFLVLTEMKRQGQPNEVVRECLKALSYYPGDIRLRSLLAETYLQMGFVGQAEEELSGITEELKDLVSVHKLQAELFARQQRTHEAREAIKRYLAYHPDDQSALDLLEEVAPVEEEPVHEAAVIAGVEEPAAEEVPAGPPEPEVEEDEQPEAIEAEPEREMPPSMVEEPLLEEETEATGMPEAQDEDAAEEMIHETISSEREAFEQVQEAMEGPEAVAEAALELAEEEPSTMEPEPEEEGEPEDLTTPTLAEIYFEQGEIDEAISAYERVLEKNPEDEASGIRLAELRDFRTAEQEKASRLAAVKAKTEHTIAVLEKWLSSIQESMSVR